MSPLSRSVTRQRFSSTLKDSYENIQVERHDEVGLIRLHRPKAFNALSDALFADLMHAASAFDQDDGIGCMVLTGSTKAFAAGADISEMKDRDFDYTYQKVRCRVNDYKLLINLTLLCRTCSRSGPISPSSPSPSWQPSMDTASEEAVSSQ